MAQLTISQRRLLEGAVPVSFAVSIVGASIQNTSLMVDPGAGFQNVITDISYSSSVAAVITVEDTAGTLGLFTCANGAPGYSKVVLVGAANSLLRADVAGATTDLTITGIGYVIPVA